MFLERPLCHRRVSYFWKWQRRLLHARASNGRIVFPSDGVSSAPEGGKSFSRSGRGVMRSGWRPLLEFSLPTMERSTLFTNYPKHRETVNEISAPQNGPSTQRRCLYVPPAGEQAATAGYCGLDPSEEI